jgi:hypothetical protein
MLIYEGGHIQAGLRHEKGVKTVWTPHEAVEGRPKKEPRFTGLFGTYWFVYLETEKLVLAVAVWPPLTALAVSW